MTDIHSHILPGIDDGARDTETSVAILEMMREQGIEKVFATPHFYPVATSLEDFSDSRARSFEALLEAVKGKDLPEIELGCELLYFRGIGKCGELDKLKMGNTKYILIEFPAIDITESVLRDLSDVFLAGGLVPVIAHIERYFKQKGYKKLLKFIADGTVPCLAQVNAESFFEKHYKRTALKLVKNNYVSFVASDAHSLHSRKPKMDMAAEFIQRKFGDDVYKKLFFGFSD